MSHLRILKDQNTSFEYFRQLKPQYFHFASVQFDHSGGGLVTVGTATIKFAVAFCTASATLTVLLFASQNATKKQELDLSL